MNFKIIKVLSFLKIIVLAIIHVLISPFLFFLTKYENYIFVITTGRSGSNYLSNLFKESTYVNAFHEGYPIINNNYNFKNNWLRIWNGFTFYFVKFPIILLSHKKGNKIYIESNHLFIKSFSKSAINVFRKKIKIIYLVREPHLVAKSMYEINTIPGEMKGNKWFLNPNSKKNKINFDKVFSRINDENKLSFKDFYKCCWYCYEIEARAIEFKNTHGVTMIEINTSELNNTEVILSKINNGLGLEIPLSEIVTNYKKVGKNLKADEKTEKITQQEAALKTSLFFNVIIG